MARAKIEGFFRPVGHWSAIFKDLNDGSNFAGVVEPHHYFLGSLNCIRNCDMRFSSASISATTSPCLSMNLSIYAAAIFHAHISDFGFLEVRNPL